MNLVHDYIHPTPGGGKCRIRLYLPEEEDYAAVVICTELASERLSEGNEGMSVTNAASELATEVVTSEDLALPVIWIEHYEDGARGSSEDPHTFDLVTFGPYRVRGNHQGEPPQLISVGPPTWKPLDRQTVQILIGEEIEP